MKGLVRRLVRRLFKPLFDRLEAEGEYIYKRSHRIILIVVSGLFLFLASLSLMLAPSVDYLFPSLVFGGVSLLGFLVGWAGKDIAVARIWGSRD